MKALSFLNLTQFYKLKKCQANNPNNISICSSYKNQTPRHILNQGSRISAHQSCVTLIKKLKMKRKKRVSPINGLKN